MIKYSPFLKLKNGELSALINLLPEDRSKIIPLLDFISNSKITEDKLIEKIEKIVKRMEKNIETTFSFYLDNYEIPDELKINKQNNYQYILDSFHNFNIIPVIGLDRSKIHNTIAIKYANKKAKKIAFRITNEYFESFIVYKKDFEEILDLIGSNLPCTLLIDCRYI
ncbi:MAG: beta family protein, partial [Treponema sp.]|nr:beta family protein [Treponema sp.]